MTNPLYQYRSRGRVARFFSKLGLLIVWLFISAGVFFVEMFAMWLINNGMDLNMTFAEHASCVIGVSILFAIHYAVNSKT